MRDQGICREVTHLSEGGLKEEAEQDRGVDMFCHGVVGGGKYMPEYNIARLGISLILKPYERK
jgi:hypothetical protein